MIRKVSLFWVVLAFCAVGILPALHAEEQKSELPPPSFDRPFPAVDAAVQTAQEEIRDPFAAQFEVKETVVAAPAAAPAALPKLQGLGLGGPDAYAVLDGEIYDVGETKKAITLLEVRRGEADISMGGGTVTLRVVEEAEMKRSGAGPRKRVRAPEAALEEKKENA